MIDHGGLEKVYPWLMDSQAKGGKVAKTLAERYREAKTYLWRNTRHMRRDGIAAAEAELDAVVKLVAIELAEWAAHATALRVDMADGDINAGPDSLEIADRADEIMGKDGA